MRLIDADALIKVVNDDIDRCYQLGFGRISGAVGPLCHFVDEINDQPTIDAASVVRCKDCVGSSIWNDKLICERISNVMDGYYHGTVEIVNPDDFCSRGIRQKATPCGAKMDGGAFDE